ncbi:MULTISPECIES: hypothetical protein [Pseudomonas]|uniref:hypothetical protein n=1 Tax=Pseudomonas TaxID=286 RepID=UPI000DAA9C42|nr:MULTISPECIES: hypothetical protein [Pseudomonas]PZE13355.1 hypothetical protein DMX10_11590 [Pseudomonas sp. 57B-090624]
MESVLFYRGLAYVSFDSQSSPSAVELTEVSIFQAGHLYEIHCKGQLPSKRVIITPLRSPTLHGQVVEQLSGVTRFVMRPG